jgi:hypothetical protein
MTKPKTKSTIDWSKCHHGTKEGYQTESDFTYLKQIVLDRGRMGRLILFLRRIA